MSADEPAPPHGTLTCPRCGNTVPPEQDWCLECGLPARTVVAPTPPWRVPIALLAAIAALALAAMAVAFVDLTADPEPPAPAPAQAPPGVPADPTQATPDGAETVTTPGSTTPVTEPGAVTVEREDEPPVTAPAPPAPPEQPQP